MIQINAINTLQASAPVIEPTGWLSIDNFLGGGLLVGGSYLFAGEPGAGKSTFLLQLAQALAKQNKKTLYISGEEQVEAVKYRAERISAVNELVYVTRGMDTDKDSEFQIDISNIMNAAQNIKPTLLIVDSLQMVHSREVKGKSGAKNQIEYCSEQLILFCQKHNIVLILINQSTKGDPFAGTQRLQHMTDTNLSLTVNKETGKRELYSKKNRSGDAQQTLELIMTQNGLQEEKTGFSIFENQESITPVENVQKIDVSNKYVRYFLIAFQVFVQIVTILFTVTGSAMLGFINGYQESAGKAHRRVKKKAFIW